MDRGFASIVHGLPPNLCRPQISQPVLMLLVPAVCSRTLHCVVLIADS